MYHPPLLPKYERRLYKLVESEAASDAVQLIYRGQSDESWRVRSSAARRLDGQPEAPALADYLVHWLINPARSERYAHAGGNSLTDLEVLASLQHHGAATCLLDFTTSFHVALWFACQDSSRPGCVFVANRFDLTPVSRESLTLSIRELLAPIEGISGEKTDPVRYWAPPPSENRVLAQQSCFIFSARDMAPACRSVPIDKNHKTQILDELEQFHSVTRVSLFRDFQGFASSHAVAQRVRVGHWRRIAFRHFRRGEYEDAILAFDDAILHERDDARLYLGRAKSRVALLDTMPHKDDERHKGLCRAKMDYSEVIDRGYGDRDRLESVLSARLGLDARIGRARVSYRLQQFKEAIDDCTVVIEGTEARASVLFLRSRAHEALGNTDEARKDRETALDLEDCNAVLADFLSEIKDPSS